MNHVRAVYHYLRSASEYVLSIAMIIEDSIHSPPPNGIPVKEKGNPLPRKAFRTPDVVIRAIATPRRALPLRKYATSSKKQNLQTSLEQDYLACHDLKSARGSRWAISFEQLHPHASRLARNHRYQRADCYQPS